MIKILGSVLAVGATLATTSTLASDYNYNACNPSIFGWFACSSFPIQKSYERGNFIVRVETVTYTSKYSRKPYTIFLPVYHKDNPFPSLSE